MTDEVTRRLESGLPLAAICAAPSIPAELGLLSGRRATANPAFIDALEKAGPGWRKGINTILLLACWEIWQERNDATFRKCTPAASNIIRRIRDGVQQWRTAGATCIESPFGEPP